MTPSVLNDPELSQKYLEQISEREPASPWGKVARAALREIAEESVRTRLLKK